jgi:hypothetical protein
MTTRFVIRFDDVTLGMAWSKFAPFDALAQELNIPYLIGVVPDCRDPALSVEPHRADFWDFVRERMARGPPAFERFPHLAFRNRDWRESTRHGRGDMYPLYTQVYTPGHPPDEGGH